MYMQIPQTKTINVVDEIHGMLVADPYRWLENAVNPEVKEWIGEQNKRVDLELKNESFKTFSDELAKNLEVTTFSNPVPVRGRYFYRERRPHDEQSVLYVKKGLQSEPVVLFDPNGKRDGNTLSIDYWSPSQTGKYIIYGISEGGDEMATLYIKNVDTGQELPEKIIRCRNSSVKWLLDDSAFFYTRNPRPGTVPKNEEHLHSKLYFHILGDDSDNDTLIFGADRPKDDMIQIGLSPDGRYVSIKVSREWTQNEIYLYDREKKELKSLVVGVPAVFSLCFLTDKVLLNTNYNANNYRVLWAPYEELYKPLDEWEEFIPEKEFRLESIRITKSKILVQYLEDVCSKVIIFDHQGNEIGNISLLKYSSLTGISGRLEEEEFFYSTESFLFPTILYRYDPHTLKYIEYRKMDSPIDSENYEVHQEWYASKDSTKVPMFVFYKKGIALTGSNPTVLCGYGGFGNNMKPSFMRDWIPWMERGGIFAVANIRGGGEFGETWHKDGIKENKQNSFDDFISAAEHLISRNYTDARHLGILGISNGGLLVSAVAVQRPDLFKAVCSRVPLTDMVRFPRFGMALRWIHEYGNPEIKEDLERILKWSPYHNVKNGVEYPATLFITADKDTRVDPLHARKMVALLQSVNKKNKILLFTETEAGHGAGKPVSKVIESQSFVLAFLARELHLNV